MAPDQRSTLSQIFIALMIFTGLVWVWTAVFIWKWPWEQSNTWKPEFRVAAVCKDKEPCGFAFSELEEARTKGTLVSLVPGESAGEIQEAQNWLKWKMENGIIEAKASSYHFQTTIRYKVENEKPVLIEYQDVSGKAFYYGVGAALFSLIGIYLRKLRR